MSGAGCKIKYGKHLTFRIPSGKKNFRLDSLGVDYSSEAISERLNGAGFEQYAKVKNLKEAARNLIFLKENGIGTYEELVKKDNEVSGDYGRSNERRKVIDERLAAITETQKYIGNYSKGQAVYNLTSHKIEKGELCGCGSEFGRWRL